MNENQNVTIPSDNNSACMNHCIFIEKNEPRFFSIVENETQEILRVTDDRK